ncbi:bifunctional riboflavin kinase/FAD synthetase [Novosphingobium resinovorum]|uniref:Riboflavin biosynthesis protein n=2 Tax=Sphingomonadaceae TaxID=41297 RepID=A0A031K0H6_9SPHN|nr:MULTISPECIES: bifunctional riboflavin kinase/FAD synthetase [Sphingomonadaceae]EJU11887.1 riboflavin kinase / FMN adenylyltransferase [Sphingomonas sp. LH128]EZP82117.1 Riboflavin kinase / FMN adenylyltransferase [Novosphingobium resinovorum]MBF7013090.1 bifunctional riboflavin kinase/FAD synthetase [Novosphingobium sp. HR1a]WJM27821.1 bifunctional riboflavin kinase/FAD synthetase [Novosphingobium resinovorum]
MIRLDNRQPVPESLRGAVLALGNFDGFHQGHQAVVGEAIGWAKAQGRPAIVATFDPHPVRHFKPDAEPFRLTTLEQRQELFAAAGADAMLVLHFDSAMAAMPAVQWIEEMLVRHMGAVGVVTGEDFTFGRAKGGNPQLLREVGAAHGLEGRTVGPVSDAGGTVSSSRIREALKSGDCQLAARLLTRPFAIRGRVQHGDKLGRTIGFPTANLDMANYLRPLYGIYAVTGRMPDGRVVHGAANIGIRPTFDPPKELLEPHFFDFAGDLYGQEIEVAFHHFLRPEAKFDSLDALIEQMDRDCVKARELLAGLS